MYHRMLALFLVLALVVVAFPWTAAQPAFAEEPPVVDGSIVYKGDVTQAEKEAASERFKALYFAPDPGTGPLEFAAGPAPTHVLGTDGLPIPHYFGPYPNYALSPLPSITYNPADNVTITAVSGGIRKFVDGLPGLGAAGANNLGQYIPIAVADNTTFPGSDYYEIALIEVEEKLHTDLPATKLRQYVQIATTVVPGGQIALTAINGTPILKGDGSAAIGVDNSHYLGPLIVAQKDRPVRIKFYNLLPIGEAGNLFIPTDTTVMGSGMGPVMGVNGSMIDYTQNRATLHLHGGHTPWISDGTPHQWITPANETTPYPKGVSVYNVPDMWYLAGVPVAAGTPGASTDPGDGSMTFYYTNQQSARFMFYHDHAMGITRLNVYAGEAAGYLVQDPVEADLVTRNIIPADQIPLVIQDKTFITDNVTAFTNIFGTYASQMAFYDPTWDYTRWGDYGDLWYPHVYMPVQNPYDIGGINAFGRWHYGPWFWPPVAAQNPPVVNPYAGDNVWEAPFMPGTPSDSMGMESFFDTPVINGTVYPYLEVDPKAYRFRILNAANDRFFNLSLYEADPNVTTSDNRTNTEIKMVAAERSSNLPAGWPTDGREGGIPDPTLRGPQMIQIGTEGGFLPKAVVLDNQPIVWNNDPTTFTAGNVESGNLILGCAERADVIVDFSAYAGKTLILYNDAPAPFPANAPQYDYYTGAPDLSDTGGSPGTIAGWGPNTRTLMQIRVAAAAPAATYDLAVLNEEFIPSGGGDGIFKRGQDPVFVGQTAYDDVYGTTYPDDPPNWGIANIQSSNLTFMGVNGTLVTEYFMEKKAIQDEMGEAFDVEYGRMSGNLGLEMPSTVAGGQNFMLYPFISPPVDLIPIGDTYDGFQIWKITHNGVDTHPIHFHLYEVQLINRVAWDGQIILPDANELGWKETIRISPLMDTIVALMPKVPTFPFDVPNSVRLLDPTKPDGAALQTPPGGFLDVMANPVTITNHYVNFGWEYVWHCHILSHEEMDMMHIFGVGFPPAAASGLSVNITGTVAGLTWLDESVNESHWTIQRAEAAIGPWTTVATPATTTGPTTGTNVTYTDASISVAGNYYYQVLATNIFGDTTDYGVSSVGFPNYSLKATTSGVALAGAVVPGTTTVALSGVTANTPLTVNFTGNAQGNVLLTGTTLNLTMQINSGDSLLSSVNLPLNSISVSTNAAPSTAAMTSVMVQAYSFLPSGANLTPGIALTVAYDPNQLPNGVVESNLSLNKWNGTAYVAVAGQVLDTNANTITATLTSFSDYAILGTASTNALGVGWNILSTPVKMHTAYDTWGEFATGASLNFTAAYRWNGTSFVWVSATQAVTPLDAMYVNMAFAGTAPVVPYAGISAPLSTTLAAGWNLVGAAFIDPTMPVNSALTTAYFGAGGTWGYSQVISPSGVNQTDWVYVRDAASPPNMQTGKGYWVFMTNPATIAGFTSTP